MADIPNRDELERQLARIMAKLLSAYGGRLLEALGDPPNITNLPPSFWENESQIMLAALRPFLENVYLEAAKRLMAATPSAIDWALVNEAAVKWASSYAFDLITGINNTTMQALQSVLSAYFQHPTTIGQLEARILELIASPVRAEMIAVTEITRAASEGEQEIARALAEQGIVMIPIWQTNNDDLVCELCGPKHGQEITDGEYPPEHPRCRCWVNHQLPKPGRRTGQQ